MTPTTKEQLIQAVERLERMAHEMFVYRTILETLNPPGWRDQAAVVFRDWSLWNGHYRAFQDEIDSIQRQDDPDQLLRITRLILAECDVTLRLDEQ